MVKAGGGETAKGRGEKRRIGKEKPEGAKKRGEIGHKTREKENKRAAPPQYRIANWGEKGGLKQSQTKQKQTKESIG